MRAALAPLAPLTKLPPTSSVPSGATARQLTTCDTPDPRADQLMPFQRAMKLAGAPSIVLKSPPTTRSPLGITARAFPALPT
jgi:hypothetical protein